jgi:hypothetical protein
MLLNTVIAQAEMKSWMGLSVAAVAVAAGIAAVALVATVLFSARKEQMSVRGLASQTLALWWALPVAGVLVLFGAKALPQFATPGIEYGHEAAPHEDESAPGIPDESLIHAEGDTEPALPVEQQSSFGTRVADAGEPLPLWVTRSVTDAGEQTAADGSVVVSSRQFATVEEAEAEVAGIARKRIVQHVSRQHSFPQSWTLPDSLLADAEVVPRRHIETISRETGTVKFNVYRAWWEIAFTPEAAATLEPVWQKQIVDRRLWSLGGLLALLTLMAGAATSYLRLDTLTAGRYRRRLLVATVLLVVAGGALGVALLPIA